ncbi:hypothetical protein CWC18_19040, partial [Pseudoalteromonas aurantia]
PLLLHKSALILREVSSLDIAQQQLSSHNILACVLTAKCDFSMMLSRVLFTINEVMFKLWGNTFISL